MIRLQLRKVAALLLTVDATGITQAVVVCGIMANAIATKRQVGITAALRATRLSLLLMLLLLAVLVLELFILLLGMIQHEPFIYSFFLKKYSTVAST